MSVAEKMTAIADAIRDKTGKTDKLSLDEMATEINEISTGERDINPEWTNWRYFSYENNRNDLVAKLKYSDTSNGTDFTYMCSNCSALTTIPALDTSNGTDFSYMFYKCGLTTLPALDTSNGTNFRYMFYQCKFATVPALDTSNGTNFSYMFYNCVNLKTVPALDTSNGTDFSWMFYGSNNMNSIAGIDFSKATNVANTFMSCMGLKDLTIVGTINITGLNVQNSSSLTHDSLMSIINALANKTGVSGTWKVTLGSTNLAKLTADEIAIAEGKGWTVA